MFLVRVVCPASELTGSQHKLRNVRKLMTNEPHPTTLSMNLPNRERIEATNLACENGHVKKALGRWIRPRLGYVSCGRFLSVRGLEREKRPRSHTIPNDSGHGNPSIGK